MFLGEEFDGIPTAYPLGLAGTVEDDDNALGHEFGLSGCGDGLPNEYCEGYQYQSGGMGEIPFIDDCPRPGVPVCGCGMGAPPSETETISGSIVMVAMMFFGYKLLTHDSSGSGKKRKRRR